MDGLSIRTQIQSSQRVPKVQEASVNGSSKVSLIRYGTAGGAGYGFCQGQRPNPAKLIECNLFHEPGAASRVAEDLQAHRLTRIVLGNRGKIADGPIQNSRHRSSESAQHHDGEPMHWKHSAARGLLASLVPAQTQDAVPRRPALPRALKPRPADAQPPTGSIELCQSTSTSSCVATTAGLTGAMAKGCRRLSAAPEWSRKPVALTAAVRCMTTAAEVRTRPAATPRSLRVSTPCHGAQAARASEATACRSHRRTRWVGSSL